MPGIWEATSDDLPKSATELGSGTTAENALGV